MVRVKNISPLGDLFVFLPGKPRRLVEAGEIIEVDEDEAESLLSQGDVWEVSN